MAATSNTAELFDRYDAIISLRNTAPNREAWLKLDKEAQKAWCEWKAAFQRSTMRDDPEIYNIMEGGTK